MTAFAEVGDLEDMLGTTFPVEQSEQVTALLEAASAHLRSVIGQNVFPKDTVTYTAWPSYGREDLPQWPVVSVDSVTRDGNAIPYTYRPGFITVTGDEPIEITFTYGVEAAPAELKRVTCVLAAQALQMIDMTGGMTAGGLSSVAIDDFRAAFADAGGQTGISLPAHVQAGLIRQFGRGGISTIEASW